MRRLPVLISTFALGGWLAACSDADPQQDDTTAPDTADTLDTMPDVERDTAPDTSPDIQPDATPDVEPDTADGDTAIIEYSLAIAKGNRCNALVPFDAPELPFSDAGTTVGLTDDYIYTTGTACGGVGSALWGDASPDVVYTVTPAISGVYNLTLLPAPGFDPALMVTDKCPPIGEDSFLTMTCLGVSDQGTEGTREFMRVPMVAGTTYYLLIDGWNNTIPAAGDYKLTVALGEDCTDGIDNDGNGFTDCRDVQCANDPLCNEANYEGGCNNRVDDDGDGLTDCADPDCSASAGCDEAIYPNGCTNKMDDDGDGLTDCQDPDCWTLATCDESTYANGCANGVDDDGDGRTDCEDPDCGAAPNCFGIGQTCAQPLFLAAGAPANGTTVGRTNNYATSASTCVVESSLSSFGAAAPDAVYSFTPTLTGRYDIRVTGNFDLGLTLTTDCSFAGGTCFASERGLLDGERIVADLTAGTTYFIIVDGWSNSSASNVGTFTILAKLASPSEVETNCENRIDEDRDGLTDCADPDCAFDLLACTEVGKCTDGIDNDNNGLTDCQDPICRLDPITCPRQAGDNCGTPLVVTTANPVTLNTCGFDVDFTLSGRSGCRSGTNVATPDAVASFTATTAGTYWIESVGSGSFDNIINIVRASSCPTTIGACAFFRDDTGAGGTEAVPVSMAANETIWLIVTGWGGQSSFCGSTTLRASLLPSENCNNGIDDDRDGLTDCADPDCRNTRFCNEFLNGDGACSDRLDNDNDGLTDCDDPDCRADTVNCPSPVGDNCFNPDVVNEEYWTASFNTCTNLNNFVPASGSGCRGTTTNTARDYVIDFEPPRSGTYRITLNTALPGHTAWDSIINVVKNAECPASPVTQCSQSVDRFSNSGVETLDVIASADDYYFLILDGYSSACGQATATILRLTDEICDDTIDNDGDGQTDCADSDCFGVGSCPLGPSGENCANPATLMLGQDMTVDTCDFTKDFTTASSGGCLETTQAPDMVFRYTATTAGNYRFTINASWYDLETVTNFVRSPTCPPTTITSCTASNESSSGTPNQTRDLALAAGETIWLVLGSNYSATECGDATLRVTAL